MHGTMSLKFLESTVCRRVLRDFAALSGFDIHILHLQIYCLNSYMSCKHYIMSEAGTRLHTDGHTAYSLMVTICAACKGYVHWPLEVKSSTPEVLLLSRRSQTLLQRRTILFSQRGMTILGIGYSLKLIRKYVVFVTDLFKFPACILDISKARMELKDRRNSCQRFA